MTDPTTQTTPTRDEAVRPREMAAHILRLAIEDRQATDTVEMNVGDLSVMLGLLLASASGERITRKDLNDAYRKGAEDGRLATLLIDNMFDGPVANDASLSPAPTSGSGAGDAVRAVSDNGKRWRLIPVDGDWEMQPVGHITVGQAERLCKRIEAALATPATSPAGGVREDDNLALTILADVQDLPLLQHPTAGAVYCANSVEDTIIGPTKRRLSPATAGGGGE